MPDPTRDPIRQLEDFGTGGLVVPPLDPARVRRLGDRRRARQRAAYTLAIAGAVVAAIVPVAVLEGRDDASPPITDHSGGPTPTPVPTPDQTPDQTPTASPTATAAPEHVTTYPDPGIAVVSASDADKLTGTSASFKAFIADQARAAAESCPEAAHVITVQKYSSAGYAVGGVNSCGGYVALWRLYDGAWGEGLATQDAWDCDSLAFLRVPRSFVGDCATESGSFGMPGAGGPEPGMTRAEAEAAGLDVTSDAAAPPCVSTRYSSPVVPGDDTRGLFSPHDGLVQVPMTSDMKTEEMVGLGTPRRRVLAAYPSGRAVGEDLWQVPRSGGTSFVIRFGADGRVTRFMWQLDAADCADYLQ